MPELLYTFTGAMVCLGIAALICKEVYTKGSLKKAILRLRKLWIVIWIAGISLLVEGALTSNSMKYLSGTFLLVVLMLAGEFLIRCRETTEKSEE